MSRSTSNGSGRNLADLAMAKGIPMRPLRLRPKIDRKLKTRFVPLYDLQTRLGKNTGIDSIDTCPIF
jgi:hypothetical protein